MKDLNKKKVKKYANRNCLNWIPLKNIQSLNIDFLLLLFVEIANQVQEIMNTNI